MKSQLLSRPVFQLPVVSDVTALLTNDVTSPPSFIVLLINVSRTNKYWQTITFTACSDGFKIDVSCFRFLCGSFASMGGLSYKVSSCCSYV